MAIIAWIVLGLIVGFVAGQIANRKGLGMAPDLGIGVVGAFVGGFVFSRFGAAAVTGVSLYSIVVALVWAALPLFVYHAVVGSHRAL